MELPRIPASVSPEMRIYLQALQVLIRKIEGLASREHPAIPDQGTTHQLPYFETGIVFTTAGDGPTMLDDTDGNYYGLYFHNGVLTSTGSLGTTPPPDP